jgi:hypothetical protein
MKCSKCLCSAEETRIFNKVEMCLTCIKEQNETEGFIKCARCSVRVVIGQKIKLMFCPNAECVNSEENY